MAGFISRFDVYKHQSVFRQRAHAVFTLPHVIGIEKSGDPRHIDALEAGINSEAVNNIDRRNDPTFDAKALRERWKLRRFALTPEPDRSRLPLSGGFTFFVDRMIRQKRLRSSHQFQQTIRTVTAREIRRDLLIANIVRRRGNHLFFAAAPDQQMAVTHAGKKFDAIASQSPPEIADDGSGFFCRDMTAGEVFHVSFSAGAYKGHEIAAERDIVGFERNTHTCGFQRRAAGMINRRVVTHNAHVTDVAAGWKSLGNDMRDDEYSERRPPIAICY